MPNWCNTNIKISGRDADKFERFVQEAAANASVKTDFGNEWLGYFLTNDGCVMEWRHDDFAEEPDEADFELDDDSQEELRRRQEAYENDEVFIPTVFSKEGKAEDMDITNYGREVNPGSHEIVEYLGQYSNIEQCLSVNMDKIQAQEKEDKQVKTKVRSM